MKCSECGLEYRHSENCPNGIFSNTPKSWAEEEAEKIFPVDPLRPNIGRDLRQQVATALRSARNRGLEEAANIVNRDAVSAKPNGYGWVGDRLKFLVESIRALKSTPRLETEK